MGKKRIIIETISPILPIILTFIEIRSKTPNPLTLILTGCAWFAVILLIFILYVIEKITEIEEIKTDIETLKKEINIDNKIIDFYSKIKYVGKDEKPS
tara:strand:+ start:1805 stop:2098 length:294 start_codon:yes stop_codon:yes gene_type:complete